MAIATNLVPRFRTGLSTNFQSNCDRRVHKTLATTVFSGNLSTTRRKKKRNLHLKDRRDIYGWSAEHVLPLPLTVLCMCSSPYSHTGKIGQRLFSCLSNNLVYLESLDRSTAATCKYHEMMRVRNSIIYFTPMTVDWFACLSTESPG